MKRNFILGEEWLYYKIYCGHRTTDTLLIDAISPLVKTLESKKKIDHWFFIRYSDPHPHLRLRFHLTKTSFLGVVISEIKKAFSPYFEQELIWKIQTDVYQREFERYGNTTIEEAENIFHIDSQICLKAIGLIENEKIAFFFALRSIDQFLSAFNFSVEDKILFSKINLEAFKKEFHSNKTLNKQLVKKYEGLKMEAQSFLTMNKHKEYQPLLDLFLQKDEKLDQTIKKLLQKEQIQQLEVPLKKLLPSYIHMTINRLFRDRQRFYEFLCYYFLYKYYRVRSVHISSFEK